MNIEKVKIVADSSSDILSLDNIAFASAPLKIMTAEREFIDNSDLNVREMVDYLKGYSGKSSTSCPNIGDWISAFGDAEYVFCITITASLSGSYNAARLAKEADENEHHGRRVYVLNSLSTGPEMRLIMEKIKELVYAGFDFDEVCKQTDEYCKNTGLLFMLESMRNLANNGRVSHVAAKMAGILGIRALGKASAKGDLEMLEKCRGEKRTVDAIIEQLKAHGFNKGKIRIAHCFNEKLAENVREKLISEFGNIDIETYNCRGLCSFYAELGGMLLGFEKQ